MVNWKEDAEFLYGLIVLVSAIIVYFSFVNQGGMELSVVAVIVLILIEVVIGFELFESNRAAARWNKLEK